MNRASLEHVLRAAAAITNQRDIVVVGSQALLGQFPNAPDLLLSSIEADVFPRADPAKSILIDGAIGELSAFHETFGYYAHGVDETTATLPPGWEQRLVPLRNENTGGATGWCLEVHDLAASKLVAGREKDLDFVQVMLREKMLNPETLAERAASLPVPSDRLKLTRERLRRLQAAL
jgi:hypothetical protein